MHAAVATLLAGLPLEDGRLTPSVGSRAAERAGRLTRVVRTPLDRLNPVLFPAVLILAENNCCVIFSVDKEAGKARVAFPEVGPDETEIGLEELGESYTGFAIYARPRFQFDERAVRTKKLEKEHWFWGVISEHRHLYRDIIVASVLSNLIAFSMPLFVMNVYNRVVPNRAVESLWVMAGFLVATAAAAGILGVNAQTRRRYLASVLERAQRLEFENEQRLSLIHI